MFTQTHHRRSKPALWGRSAPSWTRVDVYRLVTWLGGARRGVEAGVGSGGGGLQSRRRGSGGFVDADLRFKLWNAPPPVDVLELLDLDTKIKNKIK